MQKVTSPPEVNDTQEDHVGQVKLKSRKDSPHKPKQTAATRELKITPKNSALDGL